ncbi:helix-turn-helix transcriptional regulator [Thermopolyspora sp. NPDC052614]|uniref:helix-turn-helix domain-containing protein n=1 Tax=Thermopolyspora sp. NPDC052614 TaxID=3155682 RepID=UPI0034228116
MDPSRSPWHLLGAELRHWREKVLGLSMREVGKQAFCDDGDLSKWERGLTRPHADTVRRLDDIYGAGGRLVALHALAVEVERLRTLPKKGTSTEEAATERRQLLRLAAVSAGIGTLGISSESVRQMIGASFHDDFRTIANWELTCADHLYALRTRPPAQVAANLVMDLYAVQAQTRSSSPADTTELQRVLATLSVMHANALTRLGDHGAAIRWWHTARQTADASGDLGLRLLVRAQEAGHGLYGQRDPEMILRLVESAEQIAKPDQPCLQLLTTKAKALSVLGRHDEARRTLEILRRAADKDPGPDSLGFWYWRPDQVHFAESWVYAAAGEERKADTARDHVLGTAQDYQYRANVQLHDAMCMIVNGGVTEGMHRAASVIDAVPSAYRSNHILETGRLVLQTVPLPQHERPEVTEFRELLFSSP